MVGVQDSKVVVRGHFYDFRFAKQGLAIAPGRRDPPLPGKANFEKLIFLDAAALGPTFEKTGLFGGFWVVEGVCTGKCVPLKEKSANFFGLWQANWLLGELGGFQRSASARRWMAASLWHDGNGGMLVLQPRIPLSCS